ncbi:lipase family protein [Granulicella arctica]|uniref:Fungal lipase-type domain-containing protein n=1 Tax=Granulicella arctica TaxID=940613 RepID=A0A7Y9PJD4_9BACT|nr:lipase family protein [Granulicella arctica]NYF81004.1 hypothetical protein [Granulicella arctica]
MSDTLDPAKAALYGQFVAAVTSIYKADSSSLSPDPQKFIPTGWELAAWIDMSDFLLQSETPAFYGIVAQEIVNPDNRIIAIRGTEGKVEWLDDATSIFQVPFKQVPSAGKVALGFDKIYSTLQVVPVPDTTSGSTAAVEPELTGSFAEQLDQLAVRSEIKRGVVREFAAGRTRPERPTVVTGHSLGSALATLFVLENSVTQSFDISVLSTLASPKVGDLAFKQIFDALPITSWRIVNTQDAIPKLPLTIGNLDFEHVEVAYSFDATPFAKQNIGCNHSIDTYLHWLDNSHQVTTECAP